MTLLYNANYGHILYHARRFDEAIAHERALLESQPSLDQARSVLIRALIAKGDAASTLPILKQQTFKIPSVSDAGLVYAHTGQRDKALGEIERLKEMSARRLGVGYEIAVIYVALGDLANGCAALESRGGTRRRFSAG